MDKLTQSLKVFSMLMLCILFINMASALEFDNVKSYDTISREVTITNSFGLGADIGKARLNTPLNVKVPIGYQKVAEFDLWAYEDYNDIIKSIDLYDKSQKDWEKNRITRDFDIKYKTYEEIKVDDYKTSCYTDEKSLNKTQICEKIKIGSHYEKKEVWYKLTPADLKKNEFVTVGIFTDVQKGDYVEWIPSIYGVKVEEWATWEQSLNTDLISYWALDETTGTTATDSHASNDGTASTTGILDNSVVILGTAGDFGGIADTDTINMTFEVGNQIGSGDFSFNIWINASQVTDTARAVWFGDHSANSNFIQLGTEEGNAIIYHRESGASGSSISSPISANTVYMITYVRDGTNASLWIDGVYKTSGSHASNDVDLTGKITKLGNAEYGATIDYGGLLDEFAVWSRGLTSDEITSLYNGGSPPFYNESGDLSPIITFNSPAEQNYTSPQTLTFNFTAWDDINLSDVKIYVNDVLNQTNATGLNNTNYLFDVALGDGSWDVYGKATDNSSQETNTETRNYVIDSTSPTLSSAYNLTDLTTLTLPINSTWHFNATDTHLDSCYYNTTDHAQTIITCNSTINTAWTTGGNKTIQFCANDTFGFETCNTQNIYVYYISYNQSNTPETIAEGFDATFNLTVNLTNIPTTTAYLVLNNTIYWPTTTTASTNGYYFERTVQIPDTWGNATGILQDWYWNYTIDGVITNQSTSTDNITVYELAVDDCSTYGDLILNFSLNDEETNTLVNESAGANVEIDLILTSKINSSVSLTYSNTWTNENNPQVCLPNNVLNNSQYWLDLVLGFSSTDHVWEFYYIDDGTLNSSKIIQDFNGDTTSNISLMDLLTADSTSFLFNYFDQDGLAVDDAIVHVMRKYIGSGQFLEVERSKADENGDTIVHLVEEDVIYFFYITQYGELIYTSSTYTALCQATPCRIQLEASGSGATFPTDWDLIDGGAYDIDDDPTTREVNMTYSLNQTSTMNLTIYKYNSDGSYSSVASNSSTGTSGSIILTVPQSAGNVSFFATVHQDDTFVNSEWVDFEEKAQDRFGVTLALFIGALIILSFGLVAITEGVGTLVFVLLGVALSGFLGLVTTTLSTGVNIVVYLVIAGGILLWKLTGGRR